MKILRRPGDPPLSPPPPTWIVGKEVHHPCGCIFLYESVDEVRPYHPQSLIVISTCPCCKKEVKVWYCDFYPVPCT
jgi:hypothetical protein